jgi:hypothetical protein
VQRFPDDLVDLVGDDRMQIHISPPTATLKWGGVGAAPAPPSRAQTYLAGGVRLAGNADISPNRRRPARGDRLNPRGVRVNRRRLRGVMTVDAPARSNECD